MRRAWSLRHARLSIRLSLGAIWESSAHGQCSGAIRRGRFSAKRQEDGCRARTERLGCRWLSTVGRELLKRPGNASERVLGAGSREVKIGAIAGVIGIRIEGETASGVAVLGTSLCLS